MSFEYDSIKIDVRSIVDTDIGSGSSSEEYPAKKVKVFVVGERWDNELADTVKSQIGYMELVFFDWGFCMNNRLSGPQMYDALSSEASCLYYDLFSDNLLDAIIGKSDETGVIRESLQVLFGDLSLGDQPDVFYFQVIDLNEVKAEHEEKVVGKVMEALAVGAMEGLFAFYRKEGVDKISKDTTEKLFQRVGGSIEECTLYVRRTGIVMPYHPRQSNEC